jgi:glycerol-3-phosphate dehydrogenase
MRRDLEQLEQCHYDLLVIGGGIHGACVAWDAALRGLSVALVEKGDFGEATSANSLKVIHGGLRYLQDGDLGLVRLMIRERMTWMRIAPHLVHPLPCLMPTTSKLTRSKVAMTVALMMNDLIGYDRNKLPDPEKYLPKGRPLSRSECLELLPGLAEDGITGGALWYDAQIYSSERLLLAIILAAAQAGADVANYVEVTGFLGDSRGVKGIKGRDVLTNQDLEIHARLIVNCAGAWVDSVIGSPTGRPNPMFRSSVALNLVTRQILPTHGAGLPSRYVVQGPAGRPIRRSRVLFLVPWRGCSLIGTRHIPFDGPPEAYRVTEETIEDFIDEINAAYPGAALARKDVYNVHVGFLPVVDGDAGTDTVRLVRQARLHDHEREQGLAGVITVVGVKYTTARQVAEKAVDLAVAKLGRGGAPCRTQMTPAYGGQIDRFHEFLAGARALRPSDVSDAAIQHVVYSYGSEYSQVLRYIDEEPTWRRTISPGSPVLEAEVIHAVRDEMAQTLGDVVQRRTELGAAGLPGGEALRRCAELMAAELNWDGARVERELAELQGAYATFATPIRANRGID